MSPPESDPISVTELGRADIPEASGAEMVFSSTVLRAGAFVPLHSHNGDEHLHVLEGGTLRAQDGATVAFPTGAVVRFGRGEVHGGLTHAGGADIRLVSVHLVHKGRPFSVPAG